MIVQPIAAAGDQAEILIGPTWHRCTVESVGEWTHQSGNTYPVYTVRFADGATLNCGSNSLRVAK